MAELHLVCPKCGSPNLTFVGGHLACDSCGAAYSVKSASGIALVRPAIRLTGYQEGMRRGAEIAKQYGARYSSEGGDLGSDTACKIERAILAEVEKQP